jgi:hypothetical protein
MKRKPFEPKPVTTDEIDAIVHQILEGGPLDEVAARVGEPALAALSESRALKGWIFKLIEDLTEHAETVKALAKKGATLEEVDKRVGGMLTEKAFKHLGQAFQSGLIVGYTLALYDLVSTIANGAGIVPSGESKSERPAG